MRFGAGFRCESLTVDGTFSITLDKPLSSSVSAAVLGFRALPRQGRARLMAHRWHFSIDGPTVNRLTLQPV